MFKRSMSITRFKCVQEIDLTQQTVQEGLAEFAFDQNNLLDLQEVTGFTTLEDPYAGDNFIESSLFHGDYACAVFRRDTRKAPASAIKREVMAEVERVKAESGKTFVSRDTRKGIKDSVTRRLLSNMPFKTDLIPFIFNAKTGVGYFFSASSSGYSSFEDIFSRAMGVSIEIFAPDCGRDFLSWLWWRLETNDLNQPEGYELLVGGKFSVGDETGKVLSGCSSSEEIRLAVSKGCEVNRMLVQPVGEEHEVFVDVNGRLSHVDIPEECLPDEESCSLLPLIARVEHPFKILDVWAEEYRSKPKNVENFHASKASWARPAICGAVFDDI